MIYTNYPSITQYQQLVELKDYRPVTKYEYVRMVRKLAEHFKSDPASLSEKQVREYFLFLRQEKYWQGSAMTQARVALRSFRSGRSGGAGRSFGSVMRLSGYSMHGR